MDEFTDEQYRAVLAELQVDQGGAMPDGRVDAIRAARLVLRSRQRPTVRDWVVDVLAFQRKFGRPVRSTPGWPERPGITLRVALLREEFAETMAAMAKRDLLLTADGLADLIFVAIGTAAEFGVDLRPVWEEVVRTNMAKEGGATRRDGKILKPEGWAPPDIAGAIQRGKL